MVREVWFRGKREKKKKIKKIPEHTRAAATALSALWLFIVPERAVIDEF